MKIQNLLVHDMILLGLESEEREDVLREIVLDLFRFCPAELAQAEIITHRGDIGKQNA